MKEDVSSVLDSEIDYEFQGKDFGYARTEKNEVRQIKQRYMTNDIHTTEHDGPQQGEIILYQPDETVRLEVRLEDDTVWLNQAQMGELFGTNRQARHSITLIDNYIDETTLTMLSKRDDGKKLFAYIKMQETSAAELMSGIR